MNVDDAVVNVVARLRADGDSMDREAKDVEKEIASLQEQLGQIKERGHICREAADRIEQSTLAATV